MSDTIENCIDYYSIQFTKLVELVVAYFPSELKIFRTTNAGWVRYGLPGLRWEHPKPPSFQHMLYSPHSLKEYNRRALEIIAESGHDIKVYDIFWMSWARPDDYMDAVHPFKMIIQESIRKMMTIVIDHFGCLKN